MRGPTQPTGGSLSAFGLSVIAGLAEADSQIHHLAERARSLGSLLSTDEDLHAWLCSVLAVRAASRGNFGVGAVLLDGDGAVVALGENQVFFPRFRSDAHAEMIAMDEFEAQYHQPRGLGKYVMFTSLEPCPMCFARLITAGIGSIVHVSDDPSGGMIHLRSTLPSALQELAAGMRCRKSTCGDAIQELAHDAFMVNAPRLNKQLQMRTV